MCGGRHGDALLLGELKPNLDGRFGALLLGSELAQFLSMHSGQLLHVGRHVGRVQVNADHRTLEGHLGVVTLHRDVPKFVQGLPQLFRGARRIQEEGVALSWDTSHSRHLSSLVGVELLKCISDKRFGKAKKSYLGRLKAISRALSAKESSITIGVNSPYFFITAFSIRKSATAGFFGRSDP